MNDLTLLLRLALRNLFASFLNLIIGGIILVGCCLFVMGGSLVSSMDHSMSRSIIGSVAGDCQVYNSDSKDPLAIFDQWNRPDMEAIPDFSKVKAPLLSLDNVKTVVPMGINTANVAFGNSVDVALAKLRKAENARLAGDHSKDLKTQIESDKLHVQQMVKVIQGDYGKLTLVASTQAVDKDALHDLARASSSAFWEPLTGIP